LFNKRLFYLCTLILIFIFAFSAGVAAQELPDSDADGVPDEYDGCPNQTGLPENYGCPEGVSPPDSDGDGLPDVSDGCPTIAGSPMLGGCPDTDGDEVADNYDACPNEPGFGQNSGCPFGVVADLDGDGVPDRDDFCFDVPGDPAMMGCPPDRVTDFDGDGVIDFLDACYDQPGEAGNSGCPAGIVPDRDGDGVPDAEDQCPNYYGSPQNNGCIIDSDGDLIEDQYDACPNEPGDARNNGCPSGTSAPDSDGDGVPDIYDRCPSQTGANGMDCPDGDGDFVSDIDDLCPNEAGDPSIQGCPPITETTLPSNRAPLSTANIASVSNLGELRLGASQIAAAPNGTLALQTWSGGMLLYDLTNPALTPRPLESQGGRISLSADGRVAVDTLYDMQAGQPSVQVWDTTTSAGIVYFTIADEPYINDIAVNPSGSVVATAHGYVSFYAEPTPPDIRNNVRLWDATSGAPIRVIDHTEGISHVLFNPNGNQLAGVTATGVVLWDVNSGQVLGTLPADVFIANTPIAFSPDGTRLAMGTRDGSLVVWDTSNFSQVYSTKPLPQDSFTNTVSILAYSRDGSLIAASGAPFVDGPTQEIMTFSLVVLDASNGTPVQQFSDLSAPPSSIVFSGDGTLMIFNTASAIQFWGVGQ